MQKYGSPVKIDKVADGKELRKDREGVVSVPKKEVKSAKENA